MASKVVFGRFNLPTILRGLVTALGSVQKYALPRGNSTRCRLLLFLIPTLFLAADLQGAEPSPVKPPSQSSYNQSTLNQSTYNESTYKPKSSDASAVKRNSEALKPNDLRRQDKKFKPVNDAKNTFASVSAPEFKPYPAPDFTLKSTNGRSIKLSDFYGKVVMINFWASWCPPCRAEMPMLENLYKTHRHRGLVILGLNVDVDVESRDEFLKDNPVSFLVLDDSKWATAKLYVSPSQPATFFVDRSGNIVHVHQGYKAGDDAVYAAKVTELLAY